MVKSGNDGTGYHPHPQVKPSHATDVFRMGNSKSRVALLSPMTFQVGTSGGDVVIVALRHEERYEGDEVSLVKEYSDVDRFRSQDGC